MQIVSITKNPDLKFWTEELAHIVQYYAYYFNLCFIASTESYFKQIEQASCIVCKQTLDRRTGHVQTLDSRTGHIQTLDSRTGHVQTLDSRTGHVQTLDSRTGHVQNLDSRTGHVQTLDSRTGHFYQMNHH